MAQAPLSSPVPHKADRELERDAVGQGLPELTPVETPQVVAEAGNHLFSGW
ncbi:MAG: hypothetical protein V3T58_01750 [Candidatus Hydrothermarchaeales archaeon]